MLESTWGRSRRAGVGVGRRRGAPGAAVDDDDGGGGAATGAGH